MGETGSLPVTASHDGGLTWFSEPIEKMCLFSATIPAGQTHGSASCGPLFAADTSRAPWDQAFDAVQYVQFDRAAGVMVGTSFLGRVNADWSFDAVCAPTFVPGKCSPIVQYSAVRTDAWIAGGAITYAYYDGTNVWATDRERALVAAPAASGLGSAFAGRRVRAAEPYAPDRQRIAARPPGARLRPSRHDDQRAERALLDAARVRRGRHVVELAARRRAHLRGHDRGPPVRRRPTGVTHSPAC